MESGSMRIIARHDFRSQRLICVTLDERTRETCGEEGHQRTTAIHLTMFTMGGGGRQPPTPPSNLTMALSAISAEMCDYLRA